MASKQWRQNNGNSKANEMKAAENVSVSHTHPEANPNHIFYNYDKVAASTKSMQSDRR
jgi:hypothetical protein